MESGLFAIVGLVIGSLVGGLVVWLTVRLRSADTVSRLEQEAGSASALRDERDSLRQERDDASRELAAAHANLESITALNDSNSQALEQSRVEARQARETVASIQQQLAEAQRRIAEQGDIEKTLTDQFKVLATEVIDSNNEKFLTAADEKVGVLVQQAKRDFSLSKEAVGDLVKPLSDELKRIETARAQSEGGLKEQIAALSDNSRALERETGKLTTALKRPEVRGTWGEIQLRRVAELAGMANYCDYEEQVTITAGDGSVDRPDMVVRMPSNRTIVVDAKTPMNAYLESIESASEDDRETLLARHATQVKERADSLTRKAYWEALDHSPEFVVMFLPGEFLLQPALERDPELFDRAMRQKVIIATPNTLMALLKTVEMGWREARLAENAREIQRLGQDLHERLATYAEHIASVGSSLQTTVNRYNRAVGSFDGRLSVAARRFKELGVPAGDDIPETKEIDVQVRQSRIAMLPLMDED